MIRELIRNDDLGSLIKLIEEDKAILHEDSSFGSILHMAVDKENHRFVRCILEHGADPNMKSNHEERSCLRSAIVSKDIDLVRLLLDHGAALDTTDTITNPLYGAIYNDSFEIAKLLIERGLDVNVQYKAKPPHTNALTFAKTWGRTDIVKLIESKLPEKSAEPLHTVNSAVTPVAPASDASKSAKRKTITSKLTKTDDWSLHYIFEGEKPVRFREFMLSANILWITQGNVMTWGETVRKEFSDPSEAEQAYRQACEQAVSDGFVLFRTGKVDKIANDRKSLTDDIYRGSKLAFEATRRNHPGHPPAMFGLECDEVAMLITPVSNPKIDIDKLEEDELERVWILNLWEYDEGSEYLDPAYRVLLLPHHRKPIAKGGLAPKKVFDCCVEALKRLTSEGFFGTDPEERIVLFQVIDSDSHIVPNKKLNSPAIFRRYRSWVTGE
jgi:hypothetical protein